MGDPQEWNNGVWGPPVMQGKDQWGNGDARLEQQGDKDPQGCRGRSGGVMGTAGNNGGARDGAMGDARDPPGMQGREQRAMGT